MMRSPWVQKVAPAFSTNSGEHAASRQLHLKLCALAAEVPLQMRHTLQMRHSFRRHRSEPQLKLHVVDRAREERGEWWERLQTAFSFGRAAVADNQQPHLLHSRTLRGWSRHRRHRCSRRTGSVLRKL